MTPHNALNKMLNNGFTLREIASLIQSGGVVVSYSTLCRMSNAKTYPVKHDVALALLRLSEKGAKK